MNQQPSQPPKRPRFNWGSLVSLGIFVFFAFGSTIIRVVQRVFQGISTAGVAGISLDLVLPLLVGAVLVGVIGFAVLRAVITSTRAREQMHIPTSVESRPAIPRSTPTMPANPRMPSSPMPRIDMPRQGDFRPAPPQFEPVLSPRVVVASLIGAALLVGAGVAVVALSSL